MSQPLFNTGSLLAALFAACAYPLGVYAEPAADLQTIREEIRRLDASYEQRITELEALLREAGTKKTGHADIHSDHSETAADPEHANPEMMLVLSGIYGQLQQDPAIPPSGFDMAAHTPPKRGFNLGESELVLRADIDSHYTGVAAMALSPVDGMSVENAYIQSDALGDGLSLTFGRFFSGLGYLNEQHAHAWDFSDQPLVYRTFWNNQLGDDGLQLKWGIPSEHPVELGAEIGKGRGFPGTDRAKNGSGAATLFAHVGGDADTVHHWRAGLSWHGTRRENAQSDGVQDLLGTTGGVSNVFNGDSRTLGADFVWEYGRDNHHDAHFKLQGEYFQRREQGSLAYDRTGMNITDSYAVTRNGWYLQSTYQFRPKWRIGLRHDRLDPGIASIGAGNAGTVISDYGYEPSRTSCMFDYSIGEFSRLRLQLSRDLSREGLPDNQLFLQYVMGIGAHGAHPH
jgi:hypothetical protein